MSILETDFSTKFWGELDDYGISIIEEDGDNVSLTEQLDVSSFALVSLPVTEAEVHEDRTATVTLLASGTSRNSNDYSDSVVEAFIPHALTRRKMYSNHVYDKKQAMNRRNEEWVATVKEAWVVRGADGITKAKAKIRFSHMPIGEAMFREAKEDPAELGLSINAMVRGKKEKKNGRQVLSVKGWEFLFSNDFVGYNSVEGAGVDRATVSESFIFDDDEDAKKLVEGVEEKDLVWMVSEGLTDIHGIWSRDSKGEVKGKTEGKAKEGDEKNMNEENANTNKGDIAKYSFKILEDMFVDIDTYVKTKDVNEYLSDLYYAFRRMLWEILEDGEINQDKKKRKLEETVDEYFEKVKSVEFPTKESDDTMEFKLKDVLDDKGVLKEVTEHLVSSGQLVPKEDKEKVERERDSLKTEKEKLVTDKTALRKKEILTEALGSDEIKPLKISKTIESAILAFEYDPESEDKFKAAVVESLKAEKKERDELIAAAIKATKKETGKDGKTELEKHFEKVIEEQDKDENKDNGKSKATNKDLRGLFK